MSMSMEHAYLLKRNAQVQAEWHAWRQPFIVRAALMFSVPTSEVTQSQYEASYQRTLLDTMPPKAPRT